LETRARRFELESESRRTVNERLPQRAQNEGYLPLEMEHERCVKIIAHRWGKNGAGHGGRVIEVAA